MGGPLKLYDVVMHGVSTRMKLNEADARRYNAVLVEPAPGSASVEEGSAPPEKARGAQNKARQPRGKAAPGDG
ncbi:hypothetical protein ACIPW5_11445 [Streptomyces sp. NPDC090077]|uniref:hypothetical protein n=1 Tax=Streptomyces sp. NPDC090077 TaxID=3365938 RepID=UPI0037FCC257